MTLKACHHDVEEFLRIPLKTRHDYIEIVLGNVFTNIFGTLRHLLGRSKTSGFVFLFNHFLRTFVLFCASHVPSVVIKGLWLTQ